MHYAALDERTTVYTRTTYLQALTSLSSGTNGGFVSVYKSRWAFMGARSKEEKTSTKALCWVGPLSGIAADLKVDHKINYEG